MKAAEEMAARELAEAVSVIARAEREARLQAMQEREEARMRAERALAEEEARKAAAALEAEVEAELERLRSRTPMELMMDEMRQMREELESLKKQRDTKIVVFTKTSRQFWVTGPWDQRVGSCNLVDSKGNNIFHFNPRPHQKTVFISSRKMGEAWNEFARVPIQEFGLDKNNLLFTISKEEISLEWGGGQKLTYRPRVEINLGDIRFLKDDLEDKNFYTEL